MKFYITQAGQPLPETASAAALFVDAEEGELTALAVAVLTLYAQRYIAGQRSLDLERRFDALDGQFYDVRTDREVALRWAS